MIVLYKVTSVSEIMEATEKIRHFHFNADQQLNNIVFQAFPVLARILTEKKLLQTPVGLMSISAAALNDATAW